MARDIRELELRLLGEAASRSVRRPAGGPPALAGAERIGRLREGRVSNRPRPSATSKRAAAIATSAVTRIARSQAGSCSGTFHRQSCWRTARRRCSPESARSARSAASLCAISLVISCGLPMRELAAGGRLDQRHRVLLVELEVDEVAGSRLRRRASASSLASSAATGSAASASFPWSELEVVLRRLDEYRLLAVGLGGVKKSYSFSDSTLTWPAAATPRG